MRKKINNNKSLIFDDRINYRKKNVPLKKIYAKYLVIESVSECDSNCSTNAGIFLKMISN